MFLCGVGNAVPDAALQVYTLSVLLVSPATQGALFGALMRLPWQFKIAVAFIVAFVEEGNVIFFTWRAGARAFISSSLNALHLWIFGGGFNRGASGRSCFGRSNFGRSSCSSFMHLTFLVLLEGRPSGRPGPRAC
jgi:hypothetical protein